jgi:sigma-B regulation protein RsbU (phosphoserine phosphatase)
MDPISAASRASNTSILIVSSVQQSIGYENILRRNHFNNINALSDPISALQRMEHDHPFIIITDASMDYMDGFEFASNVREIERTENRFSYIILITEETVHNKVDSAWQANIDATMDMNLVPFRLIPQVMSAERITQQTNSLLLDNSVLRSHCASIEAGQMIDALTGLGNRRQAIMHVEDTIKQIESRGGVISLLLIQLSDLEQVKSTHDATIVEELILAVGHKVRRLVRPLDMVAHFGDGVFAVVMQHRALEDCRSKSYERIGQNLALKSYQTRAGYLQPKVCVGVCGAGAETGPPKVEYLIATAQENLREVSPTSEVNVSVLNPFEPNAELGRN